MDRTKYSHINTPLDAISMHKLAILRVKLDKTNSHLISEALDDLFKKYQHIFNEYAKSITN